MIRESLARKVESALQALVTAGTIPQSGYGSPEIADTKQPEHGDYACNIAMTASRLAGMNPRQFGEALAAALQSDPDLASVEVAGPGFLNFRLDPAFATSFVPKFLELGDGLKQCAEPDSGLKINVEFVSVNPNGPITIGSGRGAAYGSALCNVLEAAGHTVWREYYINDGVNSEQMRLFAESVRCLSLGQPVPENGYKGDYVQAVASRIDASLDAHSLRLEAERFMLEAQKSDLAAFGVEFDCWFSEQSLHDAGLVADEVSALESSGVADERPVRTILKMGKKGVIEEVTLETQESPTEETPQGVIDPSRTSETSGEHAAIPTPQGVADTPGGNAQTLWLRSAKFGDDQDRVLRRRDGRLTYIASDVAYHKNKFNRPAGADKLITVLGPDHHGYIGRLQAVVAAMLVAEGHVKPLSPEGRGVGERGSAHDLTIGDRTRPIIDIDGEVWRATQLVIAQLEAKGIETPSRKQSSERAQELGLQFADLTESLLDPEAVAAVPERVARSYNVFPLKKDGSTLYLAMSNPNNLEALDAVRLNSGARIIPVVAAAHEIEAANRENYPVDPMPTSAPLTDLEAKIFATPEERDTCRVAAELAKQKLEVQIFQLVRFMKEGKPAPMRKRDGNIYALIDLINEIGQACATDALAEEKQRIGRDVARFFYLSRSHDTTFDFDLDLAQKQSDENPVFYVQYAHARICSVIEKAAAEGLHADTSQVGKLEHPKELALIRKIADLPWEVARCAEDYGVHRLTTYGLELARTYHHFYDACRVINQEDRETSQARVALCEASRVALRNVFDLLGLSAPERM